MKKERNISAEASERNIISQGTRIQGELESGGDIRIDGLLNGSIISKGKVVIGESGQVEGHMKCKTADVSGHVNAQVEVEGLLTMKSTATIEGDIKTGQLAIETGAKFSGSCKMKGFESLKKAPETPKKA